MIGMNKNTSSSWKRTHCKLSSSQWTRVSRPIFSLVDGDHYDLDKQKEIDYDELTGAKDERREELNV